VWRRSRRPDGEGDRHPVAAAIRGRPTSCPSREQGEPAMPPTRLSLRLRSVRGGPSRFPDLAEPRREAHPMSTESARVPRRVAFLGRRMASKARRGMPCPHLQPEATAVPGAPTLAGQEAVSDAHVEVEDLAELREVRASASARTPRRCARSYYRCLLHAGNLGCCLLGIISVQVPKQDQMNRVSCSCMCRRPEAGPSSRH
jgi:hypothetical protein